MGESLRHVKPERIRLQGHPEFNEAWLNDAISKDPSILGLGESLYLAGQEIHQPQGGRLDLLLINRDDETRYEVELMLGETDPSHIIRCLEYWDVERKRYPTKEHVAVLVAEGVTTRFLNVIGLFNSVVPIIAIQLNALKVGDAIVLNFTKVLDVVQRAGDEDEGTGSVIVTRNDWESWSSKDAMRIVDDCLDMLRDLDSTIKPKYTRGYIGVYIGNIVDNILTFTSRGLMQESSSGALTDNAAWKKRLKDAGFHLGFCQTPELHFLSSHEAFLSSRVQTRPNQGTLRRVLQRSLVQSTRIGNSAICVHLWFLTADS